MARFPQQLWGLWAGQGPIPKGPPRKGTTPPAAPAASAGPWARTPRAARPFRLPPGERLLAEDPPVPKARVAQRVQDPDVARREEGATQLLLAVAHPGGEAQDLRRRPAPIVAPRVRKVRLGVVVPDEALVRQDELGPALCSGKVPVGHPALDVEVGLDEILPRPAALYLVLGYAQSLVDGPRLLRPEDAAPVRDDRLGRAVALHGGVEDGEVGSEVLRPG